MNLPAIGALALFGWLGIASLPTVEPAASSPRTSDDFPRERGGAKDEAKDALEGKPPPALDVRSWMNSDPLVLADLRGKVVAIKFWGVW